MPIEQSVKLPSKNMNRPTTKFPISPNIIKGQLMEHTQRLNFDPDFSFQNNSPPLLQI